MGAWEVTRGLGGMTRGLGGMTRGLGELAGAARDFWKGPRSFLLGLDPTDRVVSGIRSQL